MGTVVSKRKNLRNDAISSVAAKVRAARAFGEYLSHTHPENRNGSAHLLSDTFVGPDSDSPGGVRHHNNNHPYPHRGSPAPPESSLVKSPLGNLQPPPPSITTTKARLSLERSFSAEEDQQKCVECALQPARVYTITGEHSMLGSNRGSKESLELEVLKGASTLVQPSTSPSSTSSPTQHHLRHGHRGNTHRDDGSHRHGNPVAGGSSSNHHTLAVTGGGAAHHGHHGNHHHLSQQPLSSSVSAHNIRSWGEGGKGGSREDCSLNMALDSSGAPSRSQGSLDLESSREAGKQHRRLERMWSVDRMTVLEREDNNWYPKENMFSFQTASTTMQAISAFRGFVQRKRRERELDSAEVIQRNFRKHLRMVGSRRMKAQTFAERRAKSFNRSWSDPTPVKNDSSHDPRESGDLPASCGTLDEGEREDLDWEEEREMERLACEGDDFIPPKIMLISSKVPKAEYVPTIIRRNDPSIIPILYVSGFLSHTHRHPVLYVSTAAGGSGLLAATGGSGLLAAAGGSGLLAAAEGSGLLAAAEGSGLLAAAEGSGCWPPLKAPGCGPPLKAQGCGPPLKVVEDQQLVKVSGVAKRSISPWFNGPSQRASRRQAVGSDKP
ncbi:NMDA receptor synaptonuclear signaling and neuronal migration factor-like [Salmo trutta]|uniref:NMDA receptor synaptonuclear signaling and neuronal migration factor-like n=1 Tax=Salmo trutta TaxID=8032 RepID=UPI00113073FE|nr:NMDA receptor synaptonuclear signaling and neuronal migration factor-like [Salmo trutta]